MILPNRSRWTAAAASVALASVALPCAAAETARDAEDLPKATVVLENALKAMGGRDKIAGISSSMLKGVMNTPFGNISMEAHATMPDKFLLKQTLPGMGEVVMGSNGDVGWRINPNSGYILMPEEETARTRTHAAFHNVVLHLEKEFDDIATVEQVDFHDTPCFKLRMVDEDGTEQFAFFSVADQLIAGTVTTMNTPAGPAETTTRYEQWKTIGDVKVFTRMIVVQGGMNMTLNLEELEFDKVDEAVYELPVPVKQLVEQEKKRQEDSQAEDAD